LDDGTKSSVKDKSVFSKKSDAGKGDSPRRGISIKDWEKRFSRVFKKNKKST
jgi:hypothetical protein